jgi:tRNA pseudouridine-54 N-methylase
VFNIILDNNIIYDIVKATNKLGGIKMHESFPWIKYRVNDVKSVYDFLHKYYKPSRLKERGEDHEKEVIAYHERQVIKNGYTIISHHESLTGKPVSYIMDKNHE